MNIINLEHINKIYGEKVIFDDASFGIQERDKIGIVGINGTGKSTLLKVIAGEEVPDSGQVIRQNGLKLAFVPQNPVFPDGADIRSYALESGTDESWQVESNLTELGITDFDQKIEQLSGGQKRRVVLAKILAGNFDVLLLDEPTNHLDQEMIIWLEEYLRSYRGTVLMVTHDRYFLDRVTNRILELSHGKMYGYDADYTGFLELKAAREERELATERKRQSVLRMELEWAKRGCRARTTKQKARLERLEELKNGKAPVKDQTVELDSVETRMGKKTVELHHVSKAFGDKKILNDFDYIVLKNQRLGIIGSNGCGKSTLLKMIAGIVQPDSGSIETGETVKIGYFAQEEKHMDDSQRVIDYVKDIAEYITTKDGRISATQLLERFLFTPDMQYAPIGKLSGGEKRRLYLLGVLAENANVLLFDEAGNKVASSETISVDDAQRAGGKWITNMFEDVSGVRDAKRMVRTIKIYVEEGKGNFAAIAEVVPLRIQKVAETVTLDDATIKAGEKVKLEVKHEEGTILTGLVWTSSNEKIARINQNGVVVGVEAGTATITVKNAAGLKAECTVTVILNTEVLKALIEEYEKLDLSQYQDGKEKETFIQALKNAKAVINTAKTQKEIDAAVKALQEAKGALKPIDKPQPSVDKSKLEKFYKECLAYYKETNHSKENWAKYQAVLADVKAILENESATQNDVDNALKALIDITKVMNKELEDAGKEPTPDTGGNGGNNGSNNGGNDSVTTGDMTTWGMTAVIMLLAVGAVVVVIKKRSKIS